MLASMSRLLWDTAGPTEIAPGCLTTTCLLLLCNILAESSRSAALIPVGAIMRLQRFNVASLWAHVASGSFTPILRIGILRASMG